MSKNKKFAAYLRIFWLWVGALWSVFFVVGAGLLYFRKAIVDSIESTPHPALVYLIFAVGATAVLLLMHALYRYMIESMLISRLDGAQVKERGAILKGLSWEPDLLPVYELVNVKGGQGVSIADALENELVACEDKVLARVSLASYLGGALVGLGLVGTFVGLLGTLTDLGKIFELLVNVGAKDADPVAMFGGMIAKLQEPMRGMSTAFVASLYGLMGSLVIGLVSLSVRQAGLNVCKEAREFVREELSHVGHSVDQVQSLPDFSGLLPAIDGALIALPQGIQGMLNAQENALVQSKQMLDEHRKLFDRIKEVELQIDGMRRDVLHQMGVQIANQMSLLKQYRPEPLRRFIAILAFFGCAALIVISGLMYTTYVRFNEQAIQFQAMREAALAVHQLSDKGLNQSLPMSEASEASETKPKTEQHTGAVSKSLETSNMDSSAQDAVSDATKKNRNKKPVPPVVKKNKVETVVKRLPEEKTLDCTADQVECASRAAEQKSKSVQPENSVAE